MINRGLGRYSEKPQPEWFAPCKFQGLSTGDNNENMWSRRLHRYFIF
jgi:hypothetical protein